MVPPLFTRVCNSVNVPSPAPRAFSFDNPNKASEPIADAPSLFEDNSISLTGADKLTPRVSFEKSSLAETAPNVNDKVNNKINPYKIFLFIITPRH